MVASNDRSVRRDLHCESAGGFPKISVSAMRDNEEYATQKAAAVTPK